MVDSLNSTSSAHVKYNPGGCSTLCAKASHLAVIQRHLGRVASAVVHSRIDQPSPGIGYEKEKKKDQVQDITDKTEVMASMWMTQFPRSNDYSGKLHSKKRPLVGRFFYLI